MTRIARLFLFSLAAALFFLAPATQAQTYSKGDEVFANRSARWKIGRIVKVEKEQYYRGVITEKRGDDEFHILYDWDNTKAWVSGDRIHPAANE